MKSALRYLVTVLAIIATFLFYFMLTPWLLSSESDACVIAGFVILVGSALVAGTALAKALKKHLN